MVLTLSKPACRIFQNGFLVFISLLVWLGARPAFASTLSQGLVVHYPLDGNARDVSGNQLHATAHGNFHYTNDQLRTIGDGGDYARGGGHLRLPNLNAWLTNECTLSFWVSDEQLTHNHGESYLAFGRFAPGRLTMEMGRNTNHIGFGVFGPDVGGGPGYSPTNPAEFFARKKHLVGVKTPTTLSLYLDGVLVGTETNSLNAFPVTGGEQGVSTHWWAVGVSTRLTATYDNIRIYRRALSAEEVHQLYRLEGGTVLLDPAGAPPVINSSTTANGTVGSSFSYRITASGSPTSFSASGLPAGLSLNTSTGVISGTPTAAGTTSVSISATNAGGTRSATLTITVVRVVAPVITSTNRASGTVGSAFSFTIRATNTPDRKSTRLNSSHLKLSRMPSSA